MEVRKVIKRHGFTQKQVAEAMGVKSGIITAGVARGSFSPNRLHRIAEIIGADYAEFFEDEKKASNHRDIKKIIRHSGHTITEVAKIIGVSQGCLSNKLRQEVIDPKTLHKIADAIGVKYSELLLGHAPDTSKRVLEIVMPDNAIDGGVVERDGKKYRMMLVPVEDSRYIMNCL